MRHTKEKRSWSWTPSLIVTLGIYAFMAIWFSSKIESRVEALEFTGRKESDMLQRMTRVETQIDSIQKQGERIEKKLDDLTGG